jgi:hypothetical protein
LLENIRKIGRIFLQQLPLNQGEINGVQEDESDQVGYKLDILISEMSKIWTKISSMPSSQKAIPELARIKESLLENSKWELENMQMFEKITSRESWGKEIQAKDNTLNTTETWELTIPSEFTRDSGAMKFVLRNVINLKQRFKD